ncbi:replication initiation protein, partial [Brucella sp. 09RB8918]
LLELKEEFVQAKLPTLLQFKSKYSSRLYLFLKSEYDRQKSYKSNLYIQYEVKYLHKMFEMPQCYLDRYSKFKDMFLNKGIEEINEITNLDVTFKEEKTGRKITSITFCIKEKKNESEDISLEFLKSQLLTMKTKSDYLPNNLNSRSISILLDDKLGLQENDFKKIFS